MRLFNRQGKNLDNVPQEVQEYYQAEKRERTGIAWLLALGTLIATVLLAVALFFGGRWIYRTIFNNDQSKTSQPQTENNSNQQKPGEDQNSASQASPSTTPDPAIAPGSSPTPQTPPASSTTPPATTTPRTGPESEE